MATKPACDLCPVRNQSAFCDLPREELRTLMKAKTFNTYKKRSIIFYEGNPPMGLFCLASGKVKVYKHGMDGQIQIVRLAKAGDLLGYRSLLSGEPYSATAEVFEEAVICFMDRTTILGLMTRNAGLAMRILKKVCQELRTAEERTLDLIQKPVPQRVAELLLSLQHSFGESTPQGVRLNISLTREEMAEMIGTRSETLIRVMSEMKQRGILEPGLHSLLIRNPAELKKLVPVAS